MRPANALCLGVAIITVAVLLVMSSNRLGSQQRMPVRIDSDDIGGVVTGANGPEAGAWVIAETTDLPTKYVKIVVTDDQGRYVITRSAEGELRGLGAWLRPGRFAQSEKHAGKKSRPQSSRGAE